ncbi:hypothetical protein DERF_013152 [Dermatophagoides farinae]|uniref:Uncharacterized protein n=1 Tax=Dermatophagoides farinae TaxID=6954 RepID=A0A922HP36_DERFA|nr:hypothetical protein DERF_013152 [Dermatophagoides farinae]
MAGSGDGGGDGDVEEKNFSQAPKSIYQDQFNFSISCRHVLQRC